VVPLEARELLTSNLALIERAVAFACRRHRLDATDAEELRSIVHLRLVENDYAILRAYEQRSSFATYISIVVQRMALDYRIHAWGKWHASAEAKRLGALAVELEQIVRRDGRTLDEAVTLLAPKYEGVTRDTLQSLLARLPERAARHREVDLEEAEPIAMTDVDESLIADERRTDAERLSSLMNALMARVPDDERLILQLRFEGGMTVAQIARALGLDQKLTYRRIERRMRDIKEELLHAGISARDVLDLIGRDESLLRFDVGKQDLRPSIPGDERASARTEGNP
jgi:RNA polymerase sigma factor for flagellar operon FliA